MISDMCFDDLDKYSDNDLQIFANVIGAFLYADGLKIDGLISGGPDIDKNAMLQMLVYCDDRGVAPAAEKVEIMKYLHVINESL